MNTQQNKERVKRKVAYINSSMFEVDEYEVLKGTSEDVILLVNNRYVVKWQSKSLSKVADWYFDNSTFAPSFVFTNDETICYEYIKPRGKLRRSHVLKLCKEYHPRSIKGLSFETYVNTLETEYQNNCRALGIDVNLPQVPEDVEMCKLHGDMGVHNTIIVESDIVQIDPEPRAGSKIEDVLAFYLSSPYSFKLLSLEELYDNMNVSSQEFNYYLHICFIDRLVRCMNHHPQDYEQYISFSSQVSDELYRQLCNK